MSTLPLASVAAVVLMPATTTTLFVLYPMLAPRTLAAFMGGAAVLHVGTLVGARRPWAGVALATLGMAALVVPSPDAAADLTTGLLLPSAAAFLITVWQGMSSEEPPLNRTTIGVVIVGLATITYLYATVYPGVRGEARWAILAAVSYGVPVLAVGGAATFRRRHRIASRERAATAERNAIAAERAAIRGDLHDIVSHSLTVMIAQAEAARVGTREPHTDAGLAQIAETGRAALQGLRGMLDVLGDPLAPPLEPAQTTDVAALVSGANTSDHRVHLVVEGEPRPVPPETSLALYRGVQEALTNAIRHAHPPVTVTVTLTWGADAVTAHIADDGGSGPHQRPGMTPGTGLVGMAERVRSAGGTLTVDEGRGWTVTITLPCPPPRAERPIEGDGR